MPLEGKTLFLSVLVGSILAGAVAGFMIAGPEIVLAGYSEGGYYSQGAYSASGHVIGSGSFTTPNCVPPLSASCTFSPTSVTTGQAVTWSASASGGEGDYKYDWSGTDGLSGKTQSVQKSYSTAGTKTGSVEVKSHGQTATASCTNGGATGVTVNAAPVIVSFTSSPSAIAGGQSATLSWTSSNTTSCTLTGIGSVATSGSQVVSPASTTTYTLSCTGPGGSDSDQITVTVLPQCSDGIDNDGDGKIDYPADLDCIGSSDDTEASLFGPPGWKEVTPE